MLVSAIEDKIINIIESILQASSVKKAISRQSSLIGKDPVLDSMGLVELCVALEDLSADDFDFDFDWTSEKAMSSTKSMFRSVSSLAEEFYAQWSLKE